MDRQLDSSIRNVGKEFDYGWYEMAEVISELRDKVDDQEKEIENLQEEIEKQVK